MKRENELIRSFRQGNDEAFTALMLQYEPLFSSLLTEASASGGDSAEIRLAMEEAFRNAAIHYDLRDENRTFGAYARTAMKNQILKLRKDWSRHGFDELTENTADSFDLEQYMMERERFLLTCKKMKEICTPIEYRVFMAYLAGETPRQTAKRMKCDVKTVSNAKARALSKLHKNSAEFLI
ncbi:MAG: sigma-70 family RNA polymerase sigma factor [Clostridia bacterium]|nr:sigma-70 family RNA polymerase sigma factor [Clostridia bacterium]